MRGLPGTFTVVAVEGSFINGGQDHVGEAHVSLEGRQAQRVDGS